MSQSHMVIFQAPDGSQEFRQFESIDQVVTFVEDLRNTSGLDSAKIYRLEEVRFEFRPYYRVQMAPGGMAAAGRDRDRDVEVAPEGARSAAPSAPSATAGPTDAPMAVAPLAAVPLPQAPVAAPSAAQSPVQHAPAPRSADAVSPVGRIQVAQPVVSAAPVAESAPVPGPDQQAIADHLAETVPFTPSFTDEGFRQDPVAAASSESNLGVRPATAATVAAASNDDSASAAPSPVASAEQAENAAGDAGELDSSAQRFTSTAFGIDPPATTRRGLFGR